MRVLIPILGLIIANVACADTVEIPLPGDYDSGFLPPNDAPRTRYMSFTIPAEVISIQNLQVVLSGSNQDGSKICEREIGGGQTVLDTLSVVTPMRLILLAKTLEGDCFFGIVNLLEPIFTDASAPMNTCGIYEPLDPDLLLGTTVHAGLECNFAPDCAPYIDALTNLTEVSLILEAYIVAGERRTWGRIKALYRTGSP